jgi:hypothetical protein
LIYQYSVAMGYYRYGKRSIAGAGEKSPPFGGGKAGLTYSEKYNGKTTQGNLYRTKSQRG